MKNHILTLLMVFTLTGCDDLSSYVCFIFNEKNQCVEEILLSDKESIKLSKDEVVLGDSSLFSLAVPSDNWIKLPTGKNNKFPNRDLRLVHISGGSFIDADTKNVSSIPAIDIALKSLKDAGELPHEEIDEIEIDNWNKTTIDNALLKSCFEIEDKGSGCFYTLALKTDTNDIVIQGMAALTEELINDYESILLSIKVGHKR